jgi:DNA-binding NtrC family response regulator
MQPSMTPTVLIVDDDDHVRALLKRWLDSAGYPIREASTAEEAINVLDADPSIGVALCDVWMPGRGGLWLVEQVRQRAARVQVILATADDHVSPMVSLSAGVCAYIVKPFSRSAVTSAVNSALASASAPSTGLEGSDTLESWLRPPASSRKSDV